MQDVFIVANTHLSFVPGWNRWQLRHVRRDLAALPGPRLLIGDLNMMPPTPARLTGMRPVVAAHTFPADEPVPRPAHWLGVRLVPSEIEFWQDGPFRLHDRVRFSRAAANALWTRQRLYP